MEHNKMEHNILITQIIFKNKNLPRNSNVISISSLINEIIFNLINKFMKNKIVIIKFQK